MSGTSQQRSRLVGVDAARGIALVGMMVVHVLPMDGPDGSVSPAFQVFSGRASALFAVLAGVGIALASGGRRPPLGAASRAARRGLAARAVVIASIGLTLGSLPMPAAVILAYYGVLFLTALPVLHWPARRLAVLAGVGALVTPVASYGLRRVFTGEVMDNIWWANLGDPGFAVGSLVLFGYYPVLTWTTYLFAGLAVGRLDLRAPRTAARLVGAGAALAVAGFSIDLGARWSAGGTPALASRLGTTPGDLACTLTTLMSGTTPTQSPWWLLLAGRHSGSGPDLLHTTGTALIVLGLCLLVVPPPRRSPAVVVAPLTALGAMPLTLYTLHLLALSFVPFGRSQGTVLLLAHVATAVVLALLVGASCRRGPLEALAAAAVRRAGRSGRPASVAQQVGEGPVTDHRQM
ncbi:MAG: hypothetical protein QG622_2084 [Actinomycetota bacterium]|nr:hypothetical protein [Actinomycetota bacterium]